MTTNFAVPGCGSIMARRIVGYFQTPVCVTGMLLTLTFGTRMIAWYFTNRARLENMQDDPVAVLGEMWIQLRWALLGMGLFALSWLWALATSLSLLRQAKAAEQANQANIPPRITNPSNEM
jgi:hypothetical protein